MPSENKAPTGREVMETMLGLAKQYGADMEPKDGVIKFVLPEDDQSNPAGKSVQVEIDTRRSLMRMSDVPN